MIEPDKIYLGDCFEVMKQIPDKSIDMVLTDIPYNEVNRASNGLRKLDKGEADVLAISILDLFNELTRVCRGSMYVFCGTEQVSGIRSILVNNGYSSRLIVWEKINPSPMNGKHIWLSGVEVCVFGKMPKATFNERCKNTVLRYPSGSSKSHPTEKPLKMFEYLVTVSSNEGDTILDPFLGSGTTAEACVNLNRHFIGIEKEPKYYEIAKRRIEGAQRQGNLFKESFKMTYDNSRIENFLFKEEVI